MKEFVIRITDPSGVDQQFAVQVVTDGDVGRAAQLAIDEMIAMRGGDFAFPLFIDLHPAQDFSQVAVLYAAARERGAGVN